MEKDDKAELRRIIGTYGRYSMWCSELKVDDVTCNAIDQSNTNYDTKVYDVAEACWKQLLDLSWEDIVRVLCKYRNELKEARKLAKKHEVNYEDVCGSPSLIHNPKDHHNYAV